MCIVFLCTDERQELTKAMESLVAFEVTREDLLKEDEHCIDSTTDIEDTPPKKKPRMESKETKKSAAVSKKQSIVAAAQHRAKDIFGEQHQSEMDEMQIQIVELKKQLAAQKSKLVFWPSWQTSFDHKKAVGGEGIATAKHGV